MKTALVDFRDSFTYNIEHSLVSMGMECEVLADGKFDPKTLEHFDQLILSPGPGLPEQTSSLNTILELYAGKKPILGICLGIQGIVEFYGGSIFNLGEVRHGVESEVRIVEASPLFKGIATTFKAGLYHSWACDVTNARQLKVTAVSTDGTIMAVEHDTYPIYGVQFHPESILTPDGKQILNNFVNFRP